MSSFVSNVFDKDGNATDCLYRGFHYETGNWSDEHTTENMQISFDTEDADWDNQGVVFSSGDTVLLYSYLSDGTQCSVVRVVSDGSNSYTQDIQILDCQTPTGQLNDIDDGEVNIEVSVGSVSSDLFQWDFNGTTHYHKKYWYGQNICPEVFIDTIEYDFDDGDGFSSSSSHTYSGVGTYTVTMRATNKCGLSIEDSQDIRIKYRPPIGISSYDPSDPILNTTVTISDDATDIDGRITSIEHDFNGSNVITDSDLHKEYDKELNENHPYQYKMTINWNDFFEDRILVYNYIINLRNVPPTVDLSIVNEGDTYTLISNAFDYENLLDYVVFRLYVDSNSILEESPTEYNWSLLDTKIIADSDWTQNVVFYKGGKFKVECVAYDTAGLHSIIDEEIFDVDAISAGMCGQVTYFDWE